VKLINLKQTEGRRIWGDLYKDINEFKQGYKLRTMLWMNNNGSKPADSHSAVSRWKKSFMSAMNERIWN
jgi:hypothetical protein